MTDFRATAANPPRELKKVDRAMGFVMRVLALSFVLINIAPPPASAQVSDPSQLTSRGRMMIGGSVGGDWSNDDVADPWRLYDKWRLYARLSTTLFVKDHIGIGASLGYGMSRGDVGYTDYIASDISAGAHVLLELPLAKNVGWVAIPGVSYARLKLSSDTRNTFNVSSPGRNILEETARASQGGDSTANLLRISVSLPLLVHLSDSVGIGFGPDVWLDVFVDREPRLEGSDRETRLQLGASSWIAFSF